MNLSVRLISLSMMPSRSIHSVTNDRISSLFMAKLHTDTHTTFLYFFIHSSITCHLEAVINNSAMNMGCRYLFELMFHPFWI